MTDLKNQLQQLIVNSVDDQVPSRSGHAISKKIGVSAASLSNIKNGKWDKVSGRMLRKVAAHFGLEKSDYWKHFETPNFQLMTQLLRTAQSESKLCGIDGSTGLGKSYAMRHYCQVRKESTNHLICRKAMSQRDFAVEIAEKAGARYAGRSRYQIEKNIAAALLAMVDPIVLVDEIENLRLDCFDAIKCLVDLTEGRCSWVLIGIDIYGKIQQHAVKGKNPFRQIARRFPVQNFEFLSGIDNDEMSDMLKQLSITDRYAHEWFCEHIHDYGTLKNVAVDAIKIAKRTGDTIDRMFLSEYFGDKRKDRNQLFAA